MAELADIIAGKCGRMSDPLVNRLRSIVADTLNVPLDSVTLNTGADNLTAWDSFGHLNVILALEQEFSVVLTPEHVDAMTNVATIVELVRPMLGDRQT